MLGSLIGDAIVWMVGETVSEAFGSRARDRRAETGRFDIGFRVVSGRHRGLATDWRVATGTITPGRFRLENLTIEVASSATPILHSS
ncbi:MAG: hypothetical protein ABI067_18225 [Leifsonia sp.]